MSKRRHFLGSLVCLGGRHAGPEPLKSVEVYDKPYDKWLEIPDMNFRRRHVGVALCSRQNRLGLYAVGGHDGSRHLDSVEVLPLEPGGQWQSVMRLQTLRRGLGVTTVNVDSSTNLIFAVGGLNDQSCFPHVEIYDPELDSWIYGPALSQPRGAVACSAITTCIFAVGGSDGSFSLASGEVLDPEAGKWVPIGTMKQRRTGAAMSVLHECLWIAGGFDENIALNSVEFYDPRAGVWMNAPPMQKSRGGLGMATMGNYLFAAGGLHGHEYLSSVECLDSRMLRTTSKGQQSTNWEYVDSLQNARAGAGLVHIPYSKFL